MTVQLSYAVKFQPFPGWNRGGLFRSICRLFRIWLCLCGFAALRENFLYLRLRVLGRRSPCSIDYFLRMPGEICFVVKSNLSELCVSVVK